MERHQESRELRMELLRKGIHVLVGVLIVLCVETRLIDTALLGYATLLFAALVLYNYRAEKELLTNVLSIDRADAQVPGLSGLVYLIGCWLALMLFEPRIALASILILAFADAIAHLVRHGFGGTRATVSAANVLLATAIATIAGALAAWLYVPFWYALIAAAAAMFVEAGQLRIADHHVDDNLTIPLVAGFVLWILSLAFPF